MITIPLYLFLFAYLAFLLFFFTFLIIELTHLTSTGTFTLVSFLVTCAIVAFSALVLGATWQALRGVGWQQTITVWDNTWIAGILPSPRP